MSERWNSAIIGGSEMREELLGELLGKLAKLEELGGIPEPLKIPQDELEQLTEPKAMELLRLLDQVIDDRITEEAEAYAIEELGEGTIDE